MTESTAVRLGCARPRYLEKPEPLVFPEEEHVPETQFHYELRTLLYQLLQEYLGLSATVGSDQFVYYVADDPKQCLAPDVFVRLLPPDGDIRVWKTWERGAPDVAVEIVSDSDVPELPWQERLRRYARLGAREIVRFEPSAQEGQRLRIWDRLEETLAERVVVGDRAPSLVLSLTWMVAPTSARPIALRIARDEAGSEWVPTLAEARDAEARARQAEARARAAAEARVRELEEELRRRGG